MTNLDNESCWLIPSNQNRFDVIRALKENGRIDWMLKKQSFKVGDYVFIYLSAPYQEVRYLCMVEKIPVNKDEMINLPEYWTSPIDYETSIKGKFVRLKLVTTLGKPVTFQELLNSGDFKGKLQSARSLKNPNNSLREWGIILINRV